MQSTEVTEYDDIFYEVKIDGIAYQVYRVKPRLFRINKQGKFLFNIKAHSVEIVTNFLSRLDYDNNKTRP